jgi:hypothetical protein
MSGGVTNLLFGLGLVLVGLAVSVFAHEVGHAVFGRAAGFAINSFGIGLGRPWIVGGIGPTRIYVCHRRPFLGVTFSVYPRLYPPAARMALLLVGGLTVNLSLFLLAVLLWWLLWPRGPAIWLAMAWANGYLLLTSAWPRGFAIGGGTLRSDGMLIGQVLRDRVIDMPAPRVLQLLSTLRDHWAAVGDRLTLRSYLSAGAFARIELDDREGAEQLLIEASGMGDGALPVQRGREELVRFRLALSAAENDRAVEAINAMEDAFRSIGDDGGLLVVAAERLRMRIEERDARGALPELDKLLAHPVARAIPLVREYLLELKLKACAELDDAGCAREVVTAYEARERPRRSPTRDLRVYKAIAGLYARRHDWASAEPAYRKGVEAVVSVLEFWPVAEEQRRFAERQSHFLDEVRECFRALDKPGEAEMLVAPVVAPEERQKKAADAKVARDRRLFRSALRLLLFDFIAAGALLWAYPGPGAPESAAIATLIFVDLFCIALAATFLLFYGTVGWFFPRVRKRSGANLLSLGLIPWLSAIAVAFIELMSR